MEHYQALFARIKLATREMNIGNVAVLCGTNWQADAVRTLLTVAGIESINLLDYTGVSVDAVKVGTIKRAKGLEFKLVMLPWAPTAATTSVAVENERAARDLRGRCVATTRARDALWIGSC